MSLDNLMPIASQLDKIEEYKINPKCNQSYLKELEHLHDRLYDSICECSPDTYYWHKQFNKVYEKIMEVKNE